MTPAGIVAASGFAPDRRRSPRAALLTLIVAAHAAAILASLAPPLPPDASIPQRPFSVFDVALPPPPAPPPPPARVLPAKATAIAGGSPGHRRERPAPPIEDHRDAAPRRFAATITADALPLSPSGHVTDATGIDLGLGSGADTGGGGADGRGSGTGRGIGSDDDDGLARYGRARWVAKPSDADFYRVWPAREVDGKRVRQNGWAYLACRVRPSGHPYDCRVLYETPASIGMGAAAIDVATRSRVRPVFRNGVAMADVPVLIPIVFGPGMVEIPRVSEAISAPLAR